MKSGDSIILNGEAVTINSIERLMPPKVSFKIDPLHIPYEDALAEIQANINLYFMLQYGGKR